MDTIVADPVRVTDAAAAKVKALLDAEANPKLNLRLYVTGGGCSGLQYGFAFDEAQNEDDFSIERGGMTLLVDATSLAYVTGAEIDFEEGLEGARFVVRNPNASSTCGCGSSFSV